MPVIFRWIFFGCTNRSLIMMATLLAIYVIIESFDKARYLGHGLSTNQMLEYILLKMPFMISEFMPIMVLIGASVYLIEISRHHEVVALRAAGLGINKVLIPLLIVASLAAFMSFAIGEWITPVTNQRLDMIERVNIQHKPDPKQGVQWLKDGHRFFRLTPLSQNQFALTMLETGNKGDWHRRIDSARARYEQGTWHLNNVYISTPSSEEGMLTRHEDKLTITSGVGPETSGLPRPRHMDFFQLYHYIHDLEHAGLNASAYSYALHRKFSAPFACLLMVILAAALCLGSGDRTSKASWSLILTISLGLAFYIIGNAGHLLASSEHLPSAFAAWLPSLVFGGIAVFLLLKREGH
ncbi:MAG: LPS export ABC transporter permease LptG [Mariprofundus sp.]